VNDFLCTEHSIVETNDEQYGNSEPTYSENPLIVNAFYCTDNIKITYRFGEILFGESLFSEIRFGEKI
jgi:hypothetical protein